MDEARLFMEFILVEAAEVVLQRRLRASILCRRRPVWMLGEVEVVVEGADVDVRREAEVALRTELQTELRTDSPRPKHRKTVFGMVPEIEVCEMCGSWANQWHDGITIFMDMS